MGARPASSGRPVVWGVSREGATAQAALASGNFGRRSGSGPNVRSAYHGPGNGRSPDPAVRTAKSIRRDGGCGTSGTRTGAGCEAGSTRADIGIFRGIARLGKGGPRRFVPAAPREPNGT